MRVGTSAVTTRGFKEKDCIRTVDWIDRILNDIHDENNISQVKAEINEYMAGFPLFASEDESLSIPSMSY